MKKFADSGLLLVTVLTMVLAGYGYVLTVSFRTDANAEAVKELQAKQSQIEEVKTDIAVIKEQVLEIRKHQR